MQKEKKIKELKAIIDTQLSRVIDNDYILLDLPYYANIGDTLIWKGTEEFLKTIPYKCLYKTAIETYRSPKISNKTVILLQGGGNFGDLWRRHTEFCLRIQQEFPKNKIIILPQTVYYENKDIMRNDAATMAQHSNLTICARDTITHGLLKTHFAMNKILLVPDMAFFISSDFINKYKKNEQNIHLFFKRNDIESYTFNFEDYLPNDVKVEKHEWPSIENNLTLNKIFYYLKKIHSQLNKQNIISPLTCRIIDWFAIKIYMPYLLRIGIEFISKYQFVYSTRLHGAILAILLQKPITFFDNSYGKNNSFNNTWLKDVEEIEFIERKKE